MNYCTPYNVGKLVKQFNHSELLKQYSDIEYSLEQQNKLTEYLVLTGQVRPVIRINQSFYAVNGHVNFEYELDNCQVLNLPPDFYITTSTKLSGSVQHVHLVDKKGKSITVVKVKGLKNLPFETFGNQDKDEVLGIGSISVYQDGISNTKLYEPDVARFFGAKAPEEKFESKVTEHSTYTLLNILQEKVGASNHAESLEVAIHNSELLERNNTYLDKSPELSALFSELQIDQRHPCRFKTTKAVAEHFEKTYGLSARRSLGLALIYIDITRS